MSERWIPILRHDDGSKYSIMVDLQYRDGGLVPDKRRPCLVLVQVPFTDPGEHGMGARTDANAIDQVMEDLGPRALNESAAIYAARMRGSGRASICLYAAEESAPTVERLVRDAFKSRRIEIERRDDPEWNVYQGMLPFDDEERRFWDQMVINELQRNGDPLTPARDVRHYAYFPDEPSAQRYAKILRAERFTLSVEPSAKPEHGAAVCVIANRDDPATPEAIMPITSRLLALAKEHGGTYDGWEAKLMKRRGGLAGIVARLFGRG